MEKKENLSWLYDEDADVLYISIGEPQPALSNDTGDGVIVRYREDTKEIVGMTIIGLKQRMLSVFRSSASHPSEG